MVWEEFMEETLLTLRYIVLAAMLILLGGCGIFGGHKALPRPMEYTIYSPYNQTHTLAIAPAINLSGSRDFDPLVVSDTIYAELQQVPNVMALPLNKTLLAMQRLGIHSIEDVKTAQALAKYLGADGLIIPAVTAYDPYNPPTVGMILQLYTPTEPVPAAAPVAAAKPATVRSNPDTVIFATDIPPTPVRVANPSPAQQPAVQVAAVFQSTNQSVLKELQAYAAGRTEYDSALADHKFLMDSDAYMRFVSHAMIRRLMDGERERLAGP